MLSVHKKKKKKLFNAETPSVVSMLIDLNIYF